jgi:membrane protein implicated in regulation of membrane protease activity
MSKNKIIFSIGLISIALPILGFPPNWKSTISVLLGVILVVLSFMVAAKRRSSARRASRARRELKGQEVAIETPKPAPEPFVERRQQQKEISNSEGELSS